MTITEKKQALKPYCFEQKIALDNSSSAAQWAENFIKFCEEKMGWEVVPGPGTSLGTLVTIPGRTVQSEGSNYKYYGLYGYGLMGWDCDWTQVDGLVPEIKDVQSIYIVTNHGMELSQSTVINEPWFRNFRTWNGKKDKFNLNEERFDFIVYLGENNNGQKIGLRFKYPVCSVGYSSVLTDGNVYGFVNPLGMNLLYTAPVVTIYNSEEKDMGQLIQVPPELQTNLLPMSEEEFYKEQIGKYYIFSKKKSCINQVNAYVGSYSSGYHNYHWGEDLSYMTTWYSGYVSYLYRYDTTVGDFSHEVCYQSSKSKETQYLHFDELSLLVTTLENDEQIVLVLGKDRLCEFYGTTTSYSSSVQQGATFLKAPYNFFNTLVINNENDFVLQRALIPGQKVLCKELYCITHYPSNFEGSESYPYIYAKNEEGVWGCYRVVEVGENKQWKFAFPIITPKEELNYES